MNMKEKWSIKLKEFYEREKDNCSITEITPELLREYKLSQPKNSLYGISVLYVYKITEFILQDIKNKYMQSDTNMTFKEYVKQDLLANNMPETWKYVQSVCDDSVFELNSEE